MFRNKIIGILNGGVSSEREISLRSGKNVAEALVSKGYKIKVIDIVSEDCTEQLKTAGIDFAFNILHGRFGEDGGIQKILEQLNIPYTGSGISSSANCMHKVKCKKILIQNGLPTPEYEIPTKTVNLAAPCVIKPALEGSSIGVSIVKQPDKVTSVFLETSQKFNDVFVEKFIQGAEVTVGVMEDGRELIALPILELIPKSEFYDFTSKYTPGGTRFVLPAELSPAVTKNVQELAKSAYRALNCAGAVRVDFVIENRLKPYILEINTLPGMTDQSDLPAEAKAMGINFPDLVEKILLTAKAGKS